MPFPAIPQGTSISGGPAASGNGDSVFTNNSRTGGLTINRGINPTFLIIGAVVLGGLWVVSNA